MDSVKAPDKSLKTGFHENIVIESFIHQVIQSGQKHEFLKIIFRLDNHNRLCDNPVSTTKIIP